MSVTSQKRERYVFKASTVQYCTLLYVQIITGISTATFLRSILDQEKERTISDFFQRTLGGNCV